GLRADHQAVDLGELLAGEGGAEVGVAQAVDLEDLAFEGLVGLAVARLAAQAVDDGLVAAGFELALEAADLPRTQVEQPRCLRRRPVALEYPVHHLENVALPLAHLDPIPFWHAHRAALLG